MGEEQTAKTTQKAPTVIDLFCGVGGLTLGAVRAGFRLVAAVDNDPRNETAFGNNFPNHKYISADISEIHGPDLLEKAQFFGNAIDGVIGGPPCQGFSRIGRRKPGDERNSLFDHFCRLVDELRPTFYVAENVLGICDSQFDMIRAAAFARLDGYHNLAPIRLKASEFGAATSRERVFFFGILKGREDGLQSEDFRPPPDVAA